MKLILILLMTGAALLTGCGNKQAAIPADRAGDKKDAQKTPMEMFSKVVEAASVPESYTNAVARMKELVKEWQTAMKSQKTNQPVGLVTRGKEGFPNFTLAPVVTVAVVEKALGKPDRKTTGTIPFLYSQAGERVEGPVLWYGDVGFCFGHLDKSDCLYMMKIGSK